MINNDKINTTIKPLFKHLFPFLVIFFLVHANSFATHIRAGEITVERVNCQSLTFRFTFIGYRDTGSDVIFGEGLFYFGDGTEPMTITNEMFTSSAFGNEIEKNVLVVEHTYSAAGTYIVAYSEPNRNDGILNMDNSVNTQFYVESKLVIDPSGLCNNSPILLVPPIDEGCTQAAFYHNPGAFDPDGDSLSYEMTIPKQDRGTDVVNYRNPNLPEFYSGNYEESNENGNRRPTFTINNLTGDVVWDAPGSEGEYNIAFKIIEWRKNLAGDWIQIGYVTRDMQIIIIDCDNERPELEVPEDICVEAGTIINETILGIDPDSDSVKVEAFSQVFNLSSNSAQFTPIPGLNDFRSSPAQSNFTWDTNCSHVRSQPYTVIFKVTDNPELGPKLVTFKSWNITIVGPAPNLATAVRNLGQRSATLTWDSYLCQNADKIQIWRRVDEFIYSPEECETGLPENAGYTLIEELSPSVTSYTDTDNGAGLAFAAKYCYRLVATYPGTIGGESIVSSELCIDPILASGPVITHVTVGETGEDNGEITVSWRSPFELDLTAFQLPLHYSVTRSEGLSGNTNSVVIANNLQDTTIIDTGLDTEDKAYNYTVTVFDNVGVEIDTSVAASSVLLEPIPQFKKIELRWSADVPWSNTVQGFTHEIWRDHVGTDPNQILLYDLIDVTAEGFIYTDSGQVNNTPLLDTEVYCYFIKTYGTYGNPAIDIPQINFSQIVCAQPSDTIPPCIPTLFIDEIECRALDDLSPADPDHFFFDGADCDFNAFKNTLTWIDPGLCGEDIKYYEIYYSKTTDGNFELIAEVNDTEYIHDGLASYAGCYMIRAIDRSGNASEFSNTVCKNNCPRYVLPNVFTPNGDSYNETFKAYSSDDAELKDCPRFVKAVEIIIFNRWGKVVFDYNSDNVIVNGEKVNSPDAILVNWDGRAADGSELSTGIYYYQALVEFDVVDPSNRVKEIKGWVHLLK